MKPIRFLIWLHRWLGIAMCLLFTMWFASGMVMVYVDYPQLTEAERLRNLPQLALSKVQITPFEAASKINATGLFSSVKLTTVLNRPAFEFIDTGGLKSIVFADSGNVLTKVDNRAAINAAVWNTSNLNSIPTYDSLVNIDQWSIAGSNNRHRPLHKIRLNDELETILYVSSLTGQIVLDTRRKERFWNWLGSTLHWIYPLALRENAPLWTKVVIYTSLVGIISVVTGGVIGFMRLGIRKPYRSGSLSPYTSWTKWHHFLGISTLVFVFTFIFSGLMSMGPWGIFNSATSPIPQINRYYGNDGLRLTRLLMPASTNISGQVKEVEWHQLRGKSFYSFISSPTEREVRFSNNSAFTPAAILKPIINEAIPDLLPHAKLDSIELISSEDNYYYSDNEFLPLPIYRAKFDDAESTWYHIDVANGEILSRITSSNRLERWLFKGLHSLDFQFLAKHGSLKDAILIFLCFAGLFFSLSAVIIGWRRLVG